MQIKSRRVVRPSKPGGPKNVRWYPSKRNAVIKNALLPPVKVARGQDVGESCPVCAEGILHPERDPWYRGTQFALQYLGIKVFRWYRNRVSLCCNVCGTAFADHDANLIRLGRKWAEFGCTKMPVPTRRKRRRGRKSLAQTLIAQLHPSKRSLVNLQAGRGLISRERRLARVFRWTFILRGEVPPPTEY